MSRKNKFADMRYAYNTTMLSGLSEGGFSIEYDGMKYPFFTNTAGVMQEAVSEFVDSSHYRNAHTDPRGQKMIYIERRNTFGDVTHMWEMDMISRHFTSLPLVSG